MAPSYGPNRNVGHSMTKDSEYRWIAETNTLNREWLKSFLERPNDSNLKHLAWLRCIGLVETWDLTHK